MPAMHLVVHACAACRRIGGTGNLLRSIVALMTGCAVALEVESRDVGHPLSSAIIYA